MALYNLAHFYYEGKGGVAKDLEKAYSLARKSIDDPRVDQRRQGDPYMWLAKMHMEVRSWCSYLFFLTMKVQQLHSWFGPPVDHSYLKIFC